MVVLRLSISWNRSDIYEKNVTNLHTFAIIKPYSLMWHHMHAYSLISAVNKLREKR